VVLFDEIPDAATDAKFMARLAAKFPPCEFNVKPAVDPTGPKPEFGCWVKFAIGGDPNWLVKVVEVWLKSSWYQLELLLLN